MYVERDKILIYVIIPAKYNFMRYIFNVFSFFDKRLFSATLVRLQSKMLRANTLGNNCDENF